MAPVPGVFYYSITVLAVLALPAPMSERVFSSRDLLSLQV